MDGGKVADAPAAAGKKRRRVAFAQNASVREIPRTHTDTHAEEAGESLLSSLAHTQARARGHRATDEDAENAERVAQAIKTRKAARLAALGFGDSAHVCGREGEGEVVEGEVVEGELAEEYDDTGGADEEGGEEEEYAGTEGLTGKEALAGRAALGGREESEGDASGKGKKAVVRRLAKVHGEEAGPADEEFNEKGETIEAFHLEQERDEGYYDAEGNYVWKKRTKDDYDPWMQEIDEMDPRERARLQRAAADARKRHRVDDAGGDGVRESKSNDDEEEPESSEEEEMDAPTAARRKLKHLRALVSLLQEGETVVQALRRLGRKPQGAAAKAAAAAAAKAAPGDRGASTSKVDLTAFNTVTEAADALLREGMTDVYNMDRKQLKWELDDAQEDAGDVSEAAAQEASPAGAAGSAVPPIAETWWQYKWQEKDDAETYGPFPGSSMAAWVAAGAFNAQQPVYVREYVAPAPAVPGTHGVTFAAKADEEGSFVGSAAAPVAISKTPATGHWRRFDDPAVRFTGSV